MRWIPASLVMVMTLGPGHRARPGTAAPAAPSRVRPDGHPTPDGRITPEEYRARMLEVFFLLDRNKDGALVKDEIPGASDAAVRAADRNGDGRLSVPEYTDARMNDYAAADQNRDGALTRNETVGQVSDDRGEPHASALACPRTRERRRSVMSTLVVVEYEDQYKAEEVRLKLIKMQKDFLIDLGDAVVAVKDDKGKVKLHQAVNLTAKGAMSGGFWGARIGLIFLNPLLGVAMGATAGAVSGALTDVGINDGFMKELAGGLDLLEPPPCSSWLRKATPDKVLEELKGTGGKVLKPSLTHENETKLQAAPSASKGEAARVR